MKIFQPQTIKKEWLIHSASSTTTLKIRLINSSFNVAEGWVLRGKALKGKRELRPSVIFKMPVPQLLNCHCPQKLCRASMSTCGLILYGVPLCNHSKVLGSSVTARWKYSGELLLVSLRWTSVDRVLLKLPLPSPRFSRLDTIISARSCWSRWKFSLRQWHESLYSLMYAERVYLSYSFRRCVFL